MKLNQLIFKFQTLLQIPKDVNFLMEIYAPMYITKHLLSMEPDFMLYLLAPVFFSHPGVLLW